MSKKLISQCSNLAKDCLKTAGAVELRPAGTAWLTAERPLDSQLHEAMAETRAEDRNNLRKHGNVSRITTVAGPQPLGASTVQQGYLRLSPLGTLHARPACTCALASGVMKPVQPAQPGTVSPYTHHVMLRIPQPPGNSPTDDSIWWPPVMEK